MPKQKLFLASSSELKQDREQFEISINRKNKDWHAHGVFVELIVWEDFLDALSKTRLQDEYNQAIRECDLFVMLFCTKAGQLFQFITGTNSTLSHYMITIFKARHSGRDCRNPGSMDGFELTIHGTGYPLPGEYDELAII